MRVVLVEIGHLFADARRLVEVELRVVLGEESFKLVLAVRSAH